MSLAIRGGAAAGSAADGRRQRAAETREAILATAERMFAERGLAAVSCRQVSAAAGQGNNSAVGYHCGSKPDLVRAILRWHGEPVERIRERLVAGNGGSGELRAWLDCLVHPLPEYLSGLGTPTYFARFAAQVMGDPAYREVAYAEHLATPSMSVVLARLDVCLPGLPAAVRAQRRTMTRQLMIMTWAEHERAQGGDPGGQPAGWRDAATGLADALEGLWRAPVTGRS
jgi:AcrR family transcriptional regulator